MAYQDDEKPEKRGGDPWTLVLLGVVTAVILIGSIGVVAYTSVSWQWLIVTSILLVALISLGIWLSMRHHKALHLNDEFNKLRFRWTRTYGLAAAMFIILPVYLCLSNVKYLPEDLARVVTAVAPHPADFAHGMMFVVWTIVLCSLAADLIWQRRHK